ncbi:MAG: DUF502 domain-containing protein [Candidatus Melainabacteria bacterium]|nr:DUF502 domain-containing protein [Candidatus Melainabacteria bacterium]
METPKFNFSSHFKQRMIRGAMIFFPFAALIYGFKLALGIADGWLGSLVAIIWGSINPDAAGISHNPVFSLILVALLFYSLGSIVSWSIGNSVFKWLEQKILKIQGLGKVYGSLRKIIDMVGSSDSTSKFKRVVFVPFVAGGGLTIAFVTNEITNTTNGAQYVLVFIPTPPNPISGLVVAFPAEAVSDSDMSVEQAIQLCVSLGMAAPSELALTPPAFCRFAPGQTMQCSHSTPAEKA